MTDQSSHSKELESSENAQVSEEESAPKRFSFLLNSSVLVAVASSLLGTALGAFITGWYGLTLERQRYEYSLIQKAVETQDYHQAATRLKFLVDTGIIRSLNANAIRDLAEKDASSIPVYPPLIAKSSTPKTNPFPDYTVFVCDTQWKESSAIEMAKEIINSLSSMKRVGEVKFEQWNDYSVVPLDKLQNKFTIIVDSYERSEVDSIKNQVQKIKNLPPIQVLDNPGKETKWRLSLILCPSN